MVSMGHGGKATALFPGTPDAFLHGPPAHIGAHAVFSVHGEHAAPVPENLRGHVSGHQAQLHPPGVGGQPGQPVGGDPPQVGPDEAVGEDLALLPGQAAAAHDLDGKLLQCFGVIAHQDSSFQKIQFQNWGRRRVSRPPPSLSKTLFRIKSP